MNIFQSLILSIIQGITEFLPISSSAHLILTSEVLKFPMQGLLFDVMLHAGTLFAIILYFRKDMQKLFMSGLRLCVGKFDESTHLLFSLVLATIPAVILGTVITTLDIEFRDTTLMAVNLMGFGLVMYFVDRECASSRSFEQLSYKDALVIGLFQALALIPGVSRSGICLTGGRLLKIRRVDAARFSMILSIPTIIAATVKTTWDAYKTNSLVFDHNIVVAIFVTFLVGYMSIGWLLKWLGRFTLAPFAIYRFILGIILLFLL